jgi:hypothetical protein
VYTDVTAPGERKPILPPWLASTDAAKHHARRAGGYAWHAVRFHALRAPVYLAQALFWGARRRDCQGCQAAASSP